MPINMEENTKGSLFFWLAKKRATNATSLVPEKLVIWLNGGPGCSSMVGMMWENGPFTIHGEVYSSYELKTRMTRMIRLTLQTVLKPQKPEIIQRSSI